ncbi:hypothetical protein SAMN05216214_1101, partial [Atopomonas hussainii]
MRDALSIISDNPLRLKLALPPEWADKQPTLRLRIVVQPELANQPLKHNDSHLYYVVPLRVEALTQPIQGVSAAGPTLIAPKWIDISAEHV